jgi:hypothetical protein
MNNLEQINELINKLIDKVNDKAELEYWRSIAPNLTEEEQKKILDTLIEEDKKLQEA